MPVNLLCKNGTEIDTRNIKLLPKEKLYHDYEYVIVVTESNLDTGEYLFSHPADGVLASYVSGDGKSTVTIFSDSLPDKEYFPKWKWKKD